MSKSSRIIIKEKYRTRIFPNKELAVEHYSQIRDTAPDKEKFLLSEMILSFLHLDKDFDFLQTTDVRISNMIKRNLKTWESGKIYKKAISIRAGQLMIFSNEADGLAIYITDGAVDENGSFILDNPILKDVIERNENFYRVAPDRIFELAYYYPKKYTVSNDQKQKYFEYCRKENAYKRLNTVFE